MLTQHFSHKTPDSLLLQKNNLAVLPLTRDCMPSEEGTILSGIEGIEENSISEVWTVDKAVSRGTSEQCQWSKTSDLICVARWLTEAECTNIEESVFKAYVSLFSVLKTHGFPHPFRCWNYLPNINTGDGDEETYKRFCTGRLQAFEYLGVKPEQYPSASALGHHTKGAVIYVFASASSPEHQRNNKQVDAFKYPRQYGISSPSFTRATALELIDNRFLFISGTASIIGHETVAEGSLEKQLDVTIDNIEHLLETANPYQCSLRTLKVYLRHAEDWAFTKRWLEARYPRADIVITLADICRRDLLVEIECFCK
ncbi:hypothetical protein DRW07_16005 [Alteromonas sediminis]|uniref:Chorismatase FkbO/Hyg5-like N-terminal domain-containing protein n=1 Tax=Alteromonas sediminis TaxID=2259342 RepID=A0A3N5Y9Q1_9ALTE|nr:hypothetical protein [Alteromonas sediminis]RPJ65405.1 hypothetical protein DRW07_16005 [Alteromonas sediminis]